MPSLGRCFDAREPDSRAGYSICAGFGGEAMTLGQWTPNSVQQVDALTLLQGLPDASIDLIATDPPFNIDKATWDSWNTLEDFLAWLDMHLVEFKRVLKPNGSLYLFAATKYQAHVELAVGRHFNVLSNIRWRKDAGWHKKTAKEDIRSFMDASEAIIFAEQQGSDSTGLDIILNDLTLFTEIRSYFWNERQKVAHLSYNEINQRMGLASNGGGMASNILNSHKINWSFPTAETYQLLANATGICQKPYHELKAIYDDCRLQYEGLKEGYEGLRRPFFATADAPYTDVWDFATVNTYPGKHICEKPLVMCEHIIQRSSRPGALVLDPFCGSGNMLRAAWVNGRDFIGGDLDPHWARRAQDRATLPFNVSLFDALEATP